MESARQRRTNRACVPCRRKKVKCLGEQPICSFCRRLGQTCEYRPTAQEPAQEIPSPNVNSRIDSLEAKLDQVLNSLSTIQPHHSPAGAGSSPRSLASQRRLDPQQLERTHPKPPPVQTVRPYQDLSTTGELYLQWCHSQPLILFKKEGFLDTIESRDEELQLAIAIHASRFPPGEFNSEKEQEAALATRSCRNLVTNRIANGQVKLSTLQCLCILSVVSFADGNATQAGLDLAMARYLKDALPPGSSLGDPGEYYLCMQSLSTLHHLEGQTPDLEKSIPGGTFLQLTNRFQDSEKSYAMQKADPAEDFYRGILLYQTQAAEIWHMARAYASARVRADSPPPWSPQSDYSLVMLRNIEFECQFPLKYRYATSNFGGLSPEALSMRRDYWVSFFMTHFMHEAVYILLNHPFLLSLRLRSFRHMLPLTFMHHSFDLLSKDTAWVIFFLGVVEKQKFQLTEPVIAHCVVIVATVHLQHSFVEDDVLRNKAQRGYEICLRFLKQAALTWPRIMLMTEKLQQLRDSIAINQNTSTNEDGNSHQLWSINATLLWELLVYEKAGSFSAEASMFDDIVTLEDNQQQDVAEFAAVGSAGLFGHKAARKEHFAYPPQESTVLSNPLPPTYDPTEGDDFSADRIFPVLGDLNMVDQEYLHLQAEDFGRAMDDWIRFDIS